MHIAWSDPESFVRGGPTLISFFFLFFLVDEGRLDPNATKSGQSLARQRNAIKSVDLWRVDDDPTMNAGLVAL